MMDDSTNRTLEQLVDRVRAVRRRLISIAVLKTIAIAFVWMSLYIGVYIRLDHIYHFGPAARLIALFVLAVSGLAILAVAARSIVRHLSCSQVANTIENRIPLKQQLVTAVEYYEQKNDYPYSKELAEYLVARVDRETVHTNFKHTVPKWPGYLCAFVVLIGSLFLLSFVQNNVAFFSHYFTRLTHPTATIDPLPATELQAVTEDISAAPGRPVTLTAAIQGQVPEVGNLIVEVSPPIRMDGTDDSTRNQTRTVPPTADRNKPLLTSTVDLPEGDYRYRFEAGEAHSAWHTIAIATAPTIATLEADIVSPSGERNRVVANSAEERVLNVFKNSYITLHVTTTQPLRDVEIDMLDGRTIKPTLDTDRSFDTILHAQTEGTIGFRLTSDKGVTNDRVPGVQIALLVDKPPELKLVSPGGDYPATNVASIPITFVVSDAVGLLSARAVFEVSGAPPVSMPFEFEPGVHSATFTHVLEMEDYNLSVGDSILFYARAVDIASEAKPEPSMTSSDIYMIEIKPYRQVWHPNRAALANNPNTPSGNNAALHDSLKYVLEYTRAILKKTWALAESDVASNETRSKIDAINSDLQYTYTQLALIRDDRDYNFDAENQAAIKGILSEYQKAEIHLAKHNPKAAIDPETNAYQALRKLLLETDNKVCNPCGPPPETPDRVIVEDNVHLTRFGLEKAKEELKRISDSMNQLRREQRQIRQSFEHFLDDTRKQDTTAQKTTDEKAWISENEVSPSGTPRPASQNQSSGASPSYPFTMEGTLLPSQWNLDGSSSSASPKERWQLLEARQKELQQKIRQAIAKLSQFDRAAAAHPKAGANFTEQSKTSQEHLSEADRLIEDFLKRASNAMFQPQNQDKQLENSRAPLEAAENELKKSAESFAGALAANSQNDLTETYLKRAEELLQLADALEKAASDAEKQALLADLKQAERQFRSMANAQAQGQSGQRAGGSKSGRQGSGNQPGNTSGNSVGSSQGIGGQPMPGAFGNPDGNEPWNGLSPADAARFLAMGFHSLALASDSRNTAWLDADPSDSEYYRLEKEFFERSAHYGQQP